VRLKGLLFQEVFEQVTVHSLSILMTQNARKAAIGKRNKSEREVWGRGGQWVSQKIDFFLASDSVHSIASSIDTIFFLFKRPVSNFLSRINID